MKYLISDTREKKNQHVLDYFEAVGIKYEIAKLDFGDYMDAYRPGIVIDRKQNIAELAKNVVGKDRDRFVRELERAKAAGSKMVILVEQNRYKDRERWISVKEPADLMLWSSPHTKIRGERVFRSVSGLIAKYGISVQFCDKRTTGRNILRIIYGDSYE
ncbi:MAG: ERCC4 domain-containing protein [Clostridiales bacterium]|nr:ERCC4 domain-containing protein [Clostridiales bacterium]